MTERDTEQETDGYQFRWSRCWRRRDTYGGLRDYAALQVLEGTERLAEARTRHAEDKRGGWVEFGMIDPHVTALRVQESGRPLPEELAGHADLEAVAEQPRFA